VITDHRALEYLQSSRHLNGRLTRWALILQHYSFMVKYRPGKQHQNADGLSRQAWAEQDRTQMTMCGLQKEGEMSGFNLTGSRT